MASINMDMTTDNENDSIIPQGNCQWTASTGFRPPSDCFAPYVIRTPRRASFPPSDGVKKYDIRGFEHRRPASRNLLKEIQKMHSNIYDDEKNKFFEEHANPSKRIKYNQSEMNEELELQLESQIEPKIKSLKIEISEKK